MARAFLTLLIVSLTFSPRPAAAFDSRSAALPSSPSSIAAAASAIPSWISVPPDAFTPRALGNEAFGNESLGSPTSSVPRFGIDRNGIQARDANPHNVAMYKTYDPATGRETYVRGECDRPLALAIIYALGFGLIGWATTDDFEGHSKAVPWAAAGALLGWGFCMY